MKRLVIFITAIFLLFLSIRVVEAQPSKNIINSLNSGNVRQLIQHLHHTVEINILGDEDIGSRIEADRMLQVFFKAHRPKRFQMKHQGKAPDGSQFMIGKLYTQAGIFRTYLVIKRKKIHEISFKR